MNYSIAIRTLGKNREVLKRELVSIFAQTVLPERVVVYIAEGYERPEFQVGTEVYVWVRKGMIAQRALEYREIDSELVMLLDDDVELATDSAERMMRALEENGADCVGADTFRNQDMSVVGKVYAAVTNLVFPHWSERWAFKIHRNGSFSYNNNPKGGFYWSQSCAGPCSLWRKAALLSLHWEDELWLDDLGFAFGDDVVEFYKLYANGGRLGILYDSGVRNLDGRTASGDYQRDERKFYVRSFASLAIWHRTIYSCQSSFLGRLYCLLVFSVKVVWLFVVNVVAGVCMGNVRIPWLYVKGVGDGVRFAARRLAAAKRFITER